MSMVSTVYNWADRFEMFAWKVGMWKRRIKKLFPMFDIRKRPFFPTLGSGSMITFTEILKKIYTTEKIMDMVYGSSE